MSKVLIFAEPSSMQALRTACEELGHEPVFLSEREATTPEPLHVLKTFGDAEKTAAEIRERFADPVGIVNCIEGYVELTETLSQLLNLPTKNGKAASALRDKSAMKKSWMAADVATPRLYFAGTEEIPPLKSDNFPLVVKPVFGAASAGVTVVDNLDELQRARRAVLRFNVTALAKEGHVHSGVLVEQYIDGPEYCIDQVWSQGRPVASCVLSKGVPGRSDLLDRLYMVDPTIPDGIHARLVDTATKACASVGVTCGATHTEIRIDPRDGTAFVIEAALRPGAGCGLYPVYQRAYGIPLFKTLVAACTGSDTPVYPSAPPRESMRHYWYNTPYIDSGFIKELKTPPNFYSQHQCVDRVIWRRRVGDFLPHEGTTFGYLAWFEGILEPGDSPEVVLQAAAADLIVKVAHD